MELFDYRDIIAKHLLTYIRLKGYSKSSFSKLTGISRPTLNQILSGECPNSTFTDHIKKITGALELSADYFLTEPVVQLEKWRNPMIQYSDRSSQDKRTIEAKELLDDLDILISIAPLYL